MTRRRCESCGHAWLVFGPHDPCPSCGHEQRMELGMDDPTRVAYPDLRAMAPTWGILDGQQEELPMQ